LSAKPHLAPRDLALILAVVALWGFSFVAIKVALREIPPFALAALRFFLAAVPLVFFIKPPRMPWRFIAGYGLAIGFFQFGLLFLGMKLGMPAGLSSVSSRCRCSSPSASGLCFSASACAARICSARRLPWSASRCWACTS
jgi:hypothetical protein